MLDPRTRTRTHRRRRSTLMVGVVLTALVLASCGGSGSTPSDSSTAAASQATVATDPVAADTVAEAPDTVPAAPALLSGETVNSEALQAEVEAFSQLSPREREDLLGALSAKLERELWTLTGLEDSLGGPAAADTAFAASSASVVRAARAVKVPSIAPTTTTSVAPARAPLAFAAGRPRLQLAGLLRLQTEAGSPNVGAGIFAGLVTILLGSEGAVTASNDVPPGADPASASIEGGPEGATAKLTSSLSTAIFDAAFNETANGVDTTFRTTVKVGACPDASGKFEASALVSTSASAGRVGQNLKVEVTVTGHTNDDAEIADSDVVSRTQFADFSGAKGTFLDLSMGFPSSGAVTANFNRSGGSVTPQFTADTIRLGALLTVIARDALLKAAQMGWQSGRCVTLQPTASPGPKGLKPSATSTISAAPRSKVDGAPVGGTVKANLAAGGVSVAPADSKVPADATFTYVAPGEADQSASVTLEARSKRGVARASVDFDTKQSSAYRVVGGKQNFVVDEIVCDIMAPFVLHGGGLDMSFSGGLAGSYEYKVGPGASGGGNYTIDLPEGPGQPGTLNGIGGGSTKSAAGGFKEAGSLPFAMTPAPNCS